MPIIRDPRIIEGRKNRNREIRKMFEDMTQDHRTLEYTLECIIKKFGLSEGTIIKIIKKEGCYGE
ncbi:MAG: hypothetical protein WCL00_02205 [Bacteroidota bacterium]